MRQRTLDGEGVEFRPQALPAQGRRLAAEPRTWGQWMSETTVVPQSFGLFGDHFDAQRR